jgi:hypothetical protein
MDEPYGFRFCPVLRLDLGAISYAERPLHSYSAFLKNGNYCWLLLNLLMWISVLTLIRFNELTN